MTTTETEQNKIGDSTEPLIARLEAIALEPAANTEARDIPSDAFAHFAETAERVGATTKRLEKAAILGVYFGTLQDADLVHAVRWFAGYVFSLRDQRTTNVGGAALFTAIQAVSGSDATHLRERLVVLGDPGDTAREAFEAAPTEKDIVQTPTQTLTHIANALEELAITPGTKRKTDLVVTLLKTATALEAKYIVKLLSGDLRIGLKEGAVEDALARLAKVEVERIQRVNMLTGDIGETALLARANKLDRARMHLFHAIKFMLATPAADLDDVQKTMPEAFVVEDKYDGIRAQAHIAPDKPEEELMHGVVWNGVRVALFSRTLDEITSSFPELVAPLASHIASDQLSDPQSGLILDGEIVPVSGERILPFQILQQRLGRKTLTEEILQTIPVAFVAYDALYGPNRVLLEEPFSVRRDVLEGLSEGEAEAGKSKTVRRTPSRTFTDVEELDAEFDAARARGNEGLMVKDPASTYKPGRRGREWLKIKKAYATLDVVVTAAEVGTGRRSKFLSDYTFAVRASETDPTLLNVGKAYSGLTDVEVQTLSDWFKAHTLQEFAHGKVRTVEPKIVFEITFDRVQPSNRHKSGYALRFPRILRIRDDKPAEEIDTLDTVRRLAEELSGNAGAAETDVPETPTDRKEQESTN